MEIYSNLKQKEQNFNCVTVNTMEDLQNEITKYSDKSEYIFRGTNEAKFMMYTSAQRMLSHSNQESFFNDINNRIQLVWKSRDIMDYFARNEIPVNDILILGLLQHFQSPSTLLDFTHDINTALFFATNGLTISSEKDENIDEYFSIYAINRNIPDFCSLQSVMLNGATSAQNMVLNSNIPLDLINANSVLEEFRKLTYSQFQTITRILILGEQGKVNVEIPIFKFKCSYNITNPNLKSQSGLFILNTCYDIPLEVLLRKELHCYSPLINCINIHKSLYQDVIDNYLTPNNICNDTIYPQNEDTINIKQWLTNIGL